MSKSVSDQLDEIDKKLSETLEAAGYGRGMQQDVLQMVVPALQDIAKVQRGLLSLIQERALK